METASIAMLLALAGQCFAGDLAPGTRDTHCFTSLYGGRHVRDVHKVTKNGRTVYEGETIYSVEGGAVSFTYLSSIGGIGRGTALLDPGDWTFKLAMRATPGAPVADFVTRWHWQGPRSYVVTGGPAPVTYRRIGRPPNPKS
jgi:hypothetical protein